MFRNIKKLIELNRNVGKVPIKIDSEGRTVVAMTVRDDADFLSPYSSNAEPVLSDAVANFLEKSLKPRHYKDDLKVEIYSDCINSSEKELYEKALRNTFQDKFIAAGQKSKRDAFIALLMLIAGTFSLTFMFLLDSLGANALWLEVVDIFAWVFLWEATDIFFLQRNLEQFERRRAVAFADAKLEFLPLSNVSVTNTAKLEPKSAL